MNVISKKDLKEIIENAGEPCVSIYMPIERTGNSTRANTTRFKNRISDVDRQFAALDYDPLESEKILEPVVDLVIDNRFWVNQSDGLAIFAAPDLFRYWRLPLRFEENSTIASHFNIKPLLPLLSSDGRFFILTLSQNKVRLLENTQYHSREVVLENTPKSLAEALKYDDSERQVQLHSSGPDGQAAVFHAHGVGDEDDKKDILRFAQQVEKGVVKQLNKSQEPLVLAGNEPTIGLYRKANSYPNIVSEHIAGNPDDLKIDDLRERAWEILEPRFNDKRRKVAERFEDMQGPGLSSSKLREIVLAAWQGRIDSLIFSRQAEQWGTFEGVSNEVHFHEGIEPGDEELINVAAVYTLSNSGDVYAVEPDEVPGVAEVAAIFRY